MQNINININGKSENKNACLLNIKKVAKRQMDLSSILWKDQLSFKSREFFPYSFLKNSLVNTTKHGRN